jgi:hypothetical protein
MSTIVYNVLHLYWSAGKSLAQPISRCILFDGENISFDASLVIYINSTNIAPIMIINGILFKIIFIDNTLQYTVTLQ